MVKIIKKTEVSVDFQYMVQTSTFRKVGQEQSAFGKSVVVCSSYCISSSLMQHSASWLCGFQTPGRKGSVSLCLPAAIRGRSATPLLSCSFLQVYRRVASQWYAVADFLKYGIMHNMNLKIDCRILTLCLSSPAALFCAICILSFKRLQ